MPYYRITMERYVEGEFNSQEEAIDEFMDYLDYEFHPGHLTVEEFPSDPD